MLPMIWFDDAHRDTRDLDFLGYGEPDPDVMLATLREILARDADDGVSFAVGFRRVDRLRDAHEYDGLGLQPTDQISGALSIFNTQKHHRAGATIFGDRSQSLQLDGSLPYH